MRRGGWRRILITSPKRRQRYNPAMGKGDKRTRKGKIYKGSYGKKRPQRVKKAKKTR